MKQNKYLNLYHNLRAKIIEGEYKAGEKLPSKRVMSDMSGCSLITVEKAYGMLSEEGYITSRERSGYFVNKIEAFDAISKKEISPVISHLDEPSSGGEGHDFEYSVWFKSIRKVISEYDDVLFMKSPNKGCEILRNSIADYLYRYRGMVAQPNRIIIGSGSEQLYENVVQVLGRDKIYGIEDPPYEQIEAVYRGMGADICRLEMGNNGIKSSALGCGKFDVLHVTPFHSYPTGVTTSVAKRYEYLRWAGDEHYIVEDDFDSEFFMPGKPIESLYSLASGKSVIYINTFSKSLSPSMRMGYMILPEELLEEYDAKMGMFSCSVPVLDQYVLSEFISSGNFERHLNRVRRRMKK